MKKLALALCVTGLFAASAYAKDSAIFHEDKKAKIKKAQTAAENIVKILYGRPGEPVESQVIDDNKFMVTIGDGSAMNGAAVYRVEFRRLNLGGAEEGDRVADIRITYMFGN